MSYMDALDAVSGSQAECYITIKDKRYNFMQLISFESKWEREIIDVPILGKTSKGHKPGPGKGTWSGTAHYNQSILRKMLLEYKNTGKDITFEIQVTNEDPTSSVGRQTITHKGCLIDGGVLAKFDSNSSDYLDEEISGTFDDWDMPETFEVLPGME